MVEDLRGQELFTQNPQLLDQVEQKIEEVQSKLKGSREEIQQRAKELDLLQEVVQQKERQISKKKMK